MSKRYLVLAASLIFAAAAAPAKEPVFVVIDDASVATIGTMPVDRTVYARAIEAATGLGAKGVVLKFFLDAPRNLEADARLAAAIARGNVLMQVDSAKGSGRAPAAPFVREGWSFQGVEAPYDIGNIDPPLGAFERGARAVGFVSARDGFDQFVEVAGLWHGKTVPSLQLETVELALGGMARLEGRTLAIGSRRIRLDSKGRVPCDVSQSPALTRYGIDRLLNGSIPRETIEGRVVVVGYGRKDSPTVPLGGNSVGVHEAFNRQVSCLYRTFGM